MGGARYRGWEELRLWAEEIFAYQIINIGLEPTSWRCNCLVCLQRRLCSLSRNRSSQWIEQIRIFHASVFQTIPSIFLCFPRSAKPDCFQKAAVCSLLEKHWTNKTWRVLTLLRSLYEFMKWYIRGIQNELLNSNRTMLQLNVIKE